MKEQSEKKPGVRQASMEQKRNTILKSACCLFTQNGIDATSMEDISTHAWIGSATLYRYYPTKQLLACACALSYWQELQEQYLPLFETSAYQQSSGLCQLARILDLFPVLYEQHRGFLSFLMDFDCFLKSSSPPATLLADYEGLIFSLKDVAVSAILHGMEDGTIRSSGNAEELYFTIFHCMLSTTQKLALQGNLLPMDGLVDGKRQLTLLITTLINGLKNGKE